MNFLATMIFMANQINQELHSNNIVNFIQNWFFFCKW